ncbi:hypothetical protein [Brucella anthropi]|uniref:hypothetical protein n=1 Tax=Brucella anthropi TaxID=529 RepID=UPI00178C2634|nr:hypothetical protein [Brucella anthropi]
MSILSYKSFGILEDTRVELVDGDQVYKYHVFKDANGIEWHELVNQFGPFDYYIAMNDQGRIFSMESDPDQSQIGGSEIVGLRVSADFLYTRGQAGTVYGKIWNGSEIIEPTPEPAVTVLPSVTLWERLTEAEAEQVNAAMATQPFRTRQIFLTANTFRSDHELWPLLEQVATELFGAHRASELLAVNL